MEHSTLAAMRHLIPEMTKLRHGIHAHPEVGLATAQTARIVADTLRSWGIDVHERIGGHGVVGVLKANTGARTIGLRAELDALPIHEATGKTFASRIDGLMHACGHDGHTAMLLGAARYLASTRKFNGTVRFIFQPGEEGAGGALAMLADGLLRRFPCDTLFAMHTRPGLPVGTFAITRGAAMAAGAFFTVRVHASGGHAARPHLTANPIIAICQIGVALPSALSSCLPATEPSVAALTFLSGGSAPNIIPNETTLSGSIRAMTRESLGKLEHTLRRVVEGVAVACEVSADVEFKLIFAPLHNDPVAFDAAVAAAQDLVGETRCMQLAEPALASEDFSFMLEQAKGAYILLGNGDTSPVHTSSYDFDDAALPFGAALFARLVERQLR